MASVSAKYEKDFYAWANEQAALLRAGELAAADIEHIAEEIESMGRAEKRELISRLAVLLLHLIKWKFQPSLRSNSWRNSVRIQRRDLTRHMTDNPSLNAFIGEAMSGTYGDATITASDETGLLESAFPDACPWTFEQVMSEDFWPD